VTTSWIRRGSALVVARGGALFVASPGGQVLRFEDASAELARVALEFWSEAHTEEELLAHLRALAGECEPALVTQTTAVLRDAGAIRPVSAPSAAVEAAPSARARVSAPPRARVLVGVSGAIAATEVPSLVQQLQARRFDVTVAMTAAARRFVSRDALEAITHRTVVTGFWRPPAHGPAPHIHLATWADLIVIYPASAATIARVAHAQCTDVLSTAVVASRAPVLMVPSMNDAMYRSEPVQRNLEMLRRDGRHVTLPGLGPEVAWRPSERGPMVGAAPPPAQIVMAVELLLVELLARRAATPATAEEWDRQYATTPLSELPWFTEELDADLAAAIRAVGSGRLLDVGTGPGAVALFAARSGFDVVATDLSPAALAAARARANGLPITWVLDDALDSRLWGRFDVAVDRGCLHCLPKSAWPRYAEAAARWVAPGGTLLLKLHAPGEAGRYATQPASEAELRELFAPTFSVVKVTPSFFEGTVRPPASALLAVLVRSTGNP
jgi:SAM-dependent methyltransferase